MRDKIDFDKGTEEVKAVLTSEIDASISTAFQVLRSRIDKFGVTQPNIQRIGNSGRILIELPGAKDVERVEKLLQSTAELQFWEVYTNQELAQFFYQAEMKVRELEEAKKSKEDKKQDTIASKETDVDDLLGEVKDSIKTESVSLFILRFYTFYSTASQSN